MVAYIVLFDAPDAAGLAAYLATHGGMEIMKGVWAIPPTAQVTASQLALLADVALEDGAKILVVEMGEDRAARNLPHPGFLFW